MDYAPLKGGGGVGAHSVMLIAALRRILRPLVRFLLAQGVTYPYLAELLKSVFVEVAAQKDFALKGKRQTASRISLLTGVHRKDVKRLFATRHESMLPPPNVSLGAQLVARWLGERYVDAGGHPLPLPRLANDGGEKSFEELVASVSKDIRSRAVLDEWLRLGVVRLDEKDRVSLVVEAFVPKQGFDEKVFYLGQNVGDHLAAAVSNTLGRAAPFMERSVYYDALSRDSIEELNRLGTELGMRALQQINRRAMELEARDASERRTNDRRMNFGIYFFDAEEPQDASPPVPPQP